MEALMEPQIETEDPPAGASPAAEPPPPAGKPKPARKRGARAPRLDQVTVAAGEVQRLVEALLATYPELRDDAHVFADTLEGLTDARETVEALGARALDLADFQDEIEARNEVLKARVAENNARAARFAKQEEAVKGAMLQMLRAMTPPGGKPGIESALFTAWEQRSGDNARKLVCTDASKTPAAYKVPQPDKDDTAAIKRDLLAKKKVDGWTLGNTPEPRLEIRAR